MRGDIFCCTIYRELHPDVLEVFAQATYAAHGDAFDFLVANTAAESLLWSAAKIVDCANAKKLMRAVRLNGAQLHEMRAWDAHASVSLRGTQSALPWQQQQQQQQQLHAASHRRDRTPRECTMCHKRRRRSSRQRTCPICRHVSLFVLVTICVSAMSLNGLHGLSKVGV